MNVDKETMLNELLRRIEAVSFSMKSSPEALDVLSRAYQTALMLENAIDREKPLNLPKSPGPRKY